MLCSKGGPITSPLGHFLESPYTALVVAIVLGALALSGKFNVSATYVLLAIAWAIATLALRAQPFPILAGSSLMIAGALVLLGFMFRPTPDLTANEGVLIPSTNPNPKTNCQIPHDAFAVYYGTNVSFAKDFPVTILRMADEPMIVVDKDGDSNNLIIRTLRVFDDRNDIIARMDEDGFWVQNTNRKKRPNQSTLIVYDHNDQEALKIRFLNPKAVLIKGIFRHPKINPRYIIVTDEYMAQMPNNIRFLNNCLANIQTAITIK